MTINVHVHLMSGKFCQGKSSIDRCMRGKKVAIVLSLVCACAIQFFKTNN